MTHLFYVFQNVTLDVSKYSKFTENNPQDVRDLSKQINKKFRSRVKKFCHTSNNLIIGSNVHGSLTIKGHEKLNITAARN